MFKITLNSLKTNLLTLVLITLFSCGEDGTEPTNGVDGTNGFNALVEVQNEAPGDNCAEGGVKISVGQDANENGILDETEVASVSFVCNGINGSNGENGASLVARTTAENPGENCENGGTLIEVGADTNGNNSLDINEVQTSFFVCNGLNGANGSGSGTNGLTSLIRVTESSSCPNGGLTIELGLDTNSNLELDEDEVDASYDICNGQDGTNGLSTLSNVTTEPLGLNCENGGLKIELGLDTNENGVLDNDEVVSENYVCNGNNGTDGSDGSNGTDGTSSITRVSIENPGANCSNGGLMIEIGMDDITPDGVLQNDEVDYTYFVCNGADGSDGSDGSDGNDGLNSLIRTTTEAPGGNCSNGGIRIDIGLDTNSNGTLEVGEYMGSPIYICDGNDGNNSLITVSSFSGNQNGCTNGGLIIRSGIDDNGNGVLNAGEIDATSYVCNGADGTDGNSDGIFEFYYQEGFDTYTGVLDVSISDKNPTETGESFSVDRGTTDSHGLILFPELEKMSDLVGEEFQIVEAILYLRGVSMQIDGQSQGNWIGVKTLFSDAPLFEEDAVNWIRANGADENWALQGVTSQNQDGNANGYSDMFQLPPTGIFAFDGYIPLQLNISEVTAWTDKDTGKDANKGLVLLMADTSIPYELDIFSSNYSKDTNFRPLLYIKIKTGVRSRSLRSEKEYRAKWQSLSYKEKLAPLSKRINN